MTVRRRSTQKKAAQPFELMPVCSCGLGHTTAQLLHRVHDVRPVRRQVISSSSNASIPGGLLWTQLLPSFPFHYYWLMFSGRDDHVCLFYCYLLHYKVSVTLVRLRLPSGRSASLRSAPFGSLFHLLSICCCDCRACRSTGSRFATTYYCSGGYALNFNSK